MKNKTKNKANKFNTDSAYKLLGEQMGYKLILGLTRVGKKTRLAKILQ